MLSKTPAREIPPPVPPIKVVFQPIDPLPIQVFDVTFTIETEPYIALPALSLLMPIPAVTLVVDELAALFAHPVDPT